MKVEDCKVWVINDNATVAGETENQVIEWYEKHTGDKVFIIEPAGLKEEYAIVDSDSINPNEKIEIWKTVRQGIDEWFANSKTINNEVEEPFMVCNF